MLAAFSNTEEVMTGSSGHVPYRLQSRLEELGAEVKPAFNSVHQSRGA
ncbi:hypothetical protein N824_01790 [Pedobacter sp. V48]|nr:hypothetical protein N824_01790 [Pedobacter sp. V48]